MSYRKNRFINNKRNPFSGLIVLLPLVAFAALFALFYRGIYSVSDANAAKQQESLETALERSIIQCYAVEGTYPPSLNYLEEHYGLTYDENLFFVDYRFIGSNIMPDVSVLSRTGGNP